MGGGGGFFMWSMLFEQNKHYLWSSCESLHFNHQKFYDLTIFSFQKSLTPVYLGPPCQRKWQLKYTKNTNCNSSQGCIQEAAACPGRCSWLLILVPHSKVEECHPQSPPPGQFGAPEVFFPGSQLTLEWWPSRHVNWPCYPFSLSCLSGFIHFPFLFSLAPFFPFLFFFCFPSVTPGAAAPKAHHDTLLQVHSIYSSTHFSCSRLQIYRWGINGSRKAYCIHWWPNMDHRSNRWYFQLCS